MGNIGSEFECSACACNCEDTREGHPGAARPGDYPWHEEEVCAFNERRFEDSSQAPAFKSMAQHPPVSTLPAGRTFGSRNPEFGGVPPPLDLSPSSSPSHHALATPSSGSPAHRRQSWQDLDNDGNYRLHFNYRQGERFGLQLVETRDLLVVAQVESSGAFATTSKSSPGVWCGDVIMKANKSHGSAATLRDVLNQVATNGGQLDLLVQPRPAAFDVFLKREGPNWKKLGLSVAVDRADNIPRMRVRQVRNEGLVPKWNETNGSMRICTGDWITQVNGLIKGAEEMYAMIQASSEGQELELRIETPARDATRQDLDLVSPRAENSADRMSPGGPWRPGR